MSLECNAALRHATGDRIGDGQGPRSPRGARPSEPRVSGSPGVDRAWEKLW